MPKPQVQPIKRLSATMVLSVVEQDSDYVTWNDPSASGSLRILKALMGPITAEVMRGFGVTRRRGTETGGVLLGYAQDGSPQVITVDAFEPVSCEYAFGPSYVLSANDNVVFAETIERLRGAGNSRLLPVGFWRSNTRDHFGLEQADKDLFDSHLRPEGRVALLVKPFATRPPAAIAYFSRKGDLDGAITSEEVLLSATSANTQEALSPTPPAVDAVPVHGFAPSHPVSAGEVPPTLDSPQPAAKDPRSERGSSAHLTDDFLGPGPAKWVDDVPATLVVHSPAASEFIPIQRSARVTSSLLRSLFVASVLALGFVTGVQLGGGHITIYPAPRLGRPDLSSALNLGLTLEQVGGRVRVFWSPNSLAADMAQAGRLTIEENGIVLEQQLQPAELRGGTVLYNAGNSDVRFRLELTLSGRRSVTETATWRH